jgi:hypothetical protein
MLFVLGLCAVGLNALSFTSSSQAVHLVWLALLLAGAMAYLGERLMSSIVWAMTGGNVVFLNEHFRDHFVSAWYGAGFTYPAITAACFLIPVLCWMLVTRHVNS